MSELYLRKRLFNNIVLSLLMGVGAVFLFNPGCSGGGGETSESSVTPDTPVTPTPPDKSNGPDSECSFPDFSEQCKTAKGANYTCLPDGTCAECRAGMAGCPCVGTSTDLSRRYCLEGQGRCLGASSNPNYDDAFCSWCLPGAEYCPCVDGAKLKCADGLSCISLGDGAKVCLRKSCAEAGSSEGTRCLCEGAVGCDVTDEVCWNTVCRSCPGSQDGCPCDDVRGCSRDDGLLCEDAPGEVGVKRCSRATTCASLQCDANRLCCDNNNADLSMCDGVASGDRVKCLSECVPGWTSTNGETCNECAEGYYGEDCANECPGGASSPCSDHGTCSLSGVCECATGFSGAACDSCAAGYFGQTCAPCPGGGANACNDHGACDDGLEGSGACDCTDGTGWELPDCAVCSTGFDNSGGECLPVGVTCSPGCGDHGACTGNNVCTCDPGWDGATCGSCKAGFVGPACAECPGGASNPCSGKGVCASNAEGVAECTCVNWTGDACETCPEGYDDAGGNCTPAGVTCDPACGANGECTAQDTCTCSLGWTGGLCDQCDAGYFSASCSPCPGGAATPCNGHGTCADGLHQGGTCTCGPDWVGAACEVSADCGKGMQLAGEACVDIDECDLNNGGCGDPSRVACENATLTGDLPTCTCKGNRARLLSCQEAEALECQRYLSFVCKNSDGSTLSGGGCAYKKVGDTCVSGDESGTCARKVIGNATCDAEGDTCTNPNNAVYKGQCVKKVIWGETCAAEGAECGTGTCQTDKLDCSGCQAGYYGESCGNECPGGSTNPCSGNGVCSGATDPVCMCTAQTGWQGDDCGECAEGWVDDGNCDTDIDECASTPCQNEGTCAEVGIGDYACSCRVNANTGIPEFTGKNCEIEASDNPGGVASDGTFYVGDPYYKDAVPDAAEGASNGCNNSSEGSGQVYVHETPDSSDCANSCCDVIECDGWRDCDAIPGTYCTEAHELADKSYCLPRHPGLREEAKTTARSDKLLAIKMNHASLGQDGDGNALFPLFVVRRLDGKDIFEWGKLDVGAIGEYTALANNLRCNQNSMGNGGVPSNMTCLNNGATIAGADLCDGKRFQAECCDGDNNCGRCLGTPDEGVTGDIWPVTDSLGKAICETLPGYSLNLYRHGGERCDRDEDGWVRDTAYEAFIGEETATRSNARCDVKIITHWVLVNEYLQELWVKPKDISSVDDDASTYVPSWVCPDDTPPCMPLIETPFLDGEDITQGEAGTSGEEKDRKGYVLSGFSDDSEYDRFESAFGMNPMMKGCTSNLTTEKSDYNKNGVQDWQENQNNDWVDTSFSTIYNELQDYTFFQELYTGRIEGNSYVIRERPRCALVGGLWPEPVPLGYHDVVADSSSKENDLWKSCVRAPGAVEDDLHPEAGNKVQVNGTPLTIPGYDYAKFYWASKTTALRKNSNDSGVETNAHNRAKYALPVTSGDRPVANVQNVQPVGGGVDVPYVKEGKMQFSGGWCSVAAEHVGAYGGRTWENFSVDSRKEDLQWSLWWLMGQKFSVEDGNIVPKTKYRDVVGGERESVACTDCVWRGMNLFSQFQCVQVIDNDSKEEGWKYKKLAGMSDVAADNEYEYVFNECEKTPDCVEQHPGDCLRCRRFSVTSDGDGEDCEGTESTMCVNGVNQNEGMVGFVSIRYRFEDRDTEDGQCGGVDSDKPDKYFCPNNVGANSDVGQRKDIPRDLRGCVAEEMFEDKLCPTPGNFADDNEKDRKPMLRGLSLSPYGKISCYKEVICGDAFEDAGETCDYSMTENGWNRTCSRGDAPCSCVATREDTHFNAGSPATLDIGANGTVNLPYVTYLVGDYAAQYAWFKMTLSNYEKSVADLQGEYGLDDGGGDDIHADCDEGTNRACTTFRKRMKIKVKQGYTFAFFKTKPNNANTTIGDFITDPFHDDRHGNSKDTCNSGSYSEFEFFDKEPEVKWGVHWKDQRTKAKYDNADPVQGYANRSQGSGPCQAIEERDPDDESVVLSTNYVCPFDVKYYVPGYYIGHAKDPKNGTETQFSAGGENNYQAEGGARTTPFPVPKYKEPRNGDEVWVRVRRDSYNFPAQNECSRPLDLALCMDDTHAHSTDSSKGICDNPSF